MVAKLIVASGKSAGRSIAFKQGKLLIGRAEDCDVRPLGEEVSRRHCVVRVEGEAITVEDLKSRNGTYVHGERVSAAKVTVADGVIIRVGPLELKVSCAAPAPAQPDQPAAHTERVQLERKDAVPVIGRRSFRWRTQDRHQARMLFWACRRFSASSNTTDCGPSITSAVTSSPRWAGRQCMKIASFLACFIRCLST